MSTLRMGLKSVLRVVGEEEKSFSEGELEQLKTVIGVAAAGRRAVARQLAAMPQRPWTGRPDVVVTVPPDATSASDEAAAGRVELNRALDGVAESSLSTEVAPAADETAETGEVWR